MNENANLTDLDTILSVSFPEPGKPRSRKVVSRSRSIGTGKFPSWKMGRMIQWESIHERNAFCLLDANPSVTKFSEQPCEITYSLGGQARKHYPDILVETLAGTELWEVKPGAADIDGETRLRTMLMERDLPALGYRYRMVLGSDLSSEPLLSNSRLILRWGRNRSPDSEAERLRNEFSGPRVGRWGDIMSGRHGHAAKHHVCRLVLEGILRLDLTSALTPDSPVYAIEGDE